MNKPFALAALIALSLAAACSAASPTRSPSAEERAAVLSALSAKQQALVPIAAFTAKGDLDELRPALAAGLEAGWTISELKEVLIQLYAYAGFPRSLNALNAFADVLDERKRSGLHDEAGREPSPLPAGKSSVELGAEIRTALVGEAPPARYAAFAPAIDTFLKGHLFGDIFGRDNLDVQSRELATISALATLEGLNAQLASHFKVGINTGLREPQLRGVIAVLEGKLGAARAGNARAVLAQALSAPRPSRPAQPAPASPPAATPAVAAASESKIQIARRDPLVEQRAPAEHFEGLALVHRMFQASAPSRIAGASVTFEAAARTDWHTHPAGQTLIVTAGTGRVQQWGAPVQIIAVNDVVWIPPGVKHWHGASETAAMTHVAIAEQLDGKSVEWLERVHEGPPARAP